MMINSLRPCAWAVTDASGFMSLHKEQARAEGYLRNVRGGVVDPLVRLSDVKRLLAEIAGDTPAGQGET